MTRLYLHVILPLLLVLAAGVVLVHARPHGDHALRKLLMPDGCPMPCFIGIRPGVTTVNEAVRLLEKSAWVNPSSVTVSSRYNVVRLEWAWNGHQPAALDSGAAATAVATILPGFNQDSPLDEGQRVITGMSINTRISYGDVRLLLGRGDNKPDYLLSPRYTNPRITAVYSDYGLVVISALMPCPVSLSDFWNKTVVLQIGYTFVDDFTHMCRGAA
jgi:hypothetical protein